MRQIVVTGVGMILTFTAGVTVGASAYRKFVIKRMQKVVPLMQESIKHVVIRGIKEGANDSEKLQKIADEEMEFMKIAMNTLLGESDE